MFKSTLKARDLGRNVLDLKIRTPAKLKKIIG